jgi:hypothetical protein
MNKLFISLLCTALPLALSAEIPALDAGTDDHAQTQAQGETSPALPSRECSFGPFLERVKGADMECEALRPFMVVYRADDGFTQKSSFYPLFSLRDYAGGSNWSVLGLLNGASTISNDGVTQEQDLALWPIFWHHDGGSPEQSYDAVFPLAGRLQNRLFHKQIDWFMFPLFARLEKQDHVDTCLLWPILRHREGPESGGWAVWPLMGSFWKDDVYEENYFLWPLCYDYTRHIPQERGGGEYRKSGVLPLYAEESAPGMESRTFLWPFFGFTTETAPRKTYGEVRYLYPLWVRGRGEEKTIDRWLPFYANQTWPGHEKTWWLWPLLKREHSVVEGLDVDKDTLLYFIFKNEVQTVPGRDFEARKTQLWPLFGYADNGAGRRQLMILNPIEPLISGNTMMRQTWAPFFALCRYEESGNDSRLGLVWNLFTYESSQERKAFSLWPLFDRETGANEGWSVCKGLLECDSSGSAEAGWSALWGLLDWKDGDDQNVE